jgi:hypothetical protein
MTMIIDGHYIGPGADLRGVRLHEADLRGADLTGADLSGAYLYKLNLTGAILDGAIMLDARLISNTISRASFRGAILVDAEIRGTPNEERGVDFSNADLRGVKISQLFLRDSDLTGAQFSLNTDENSEYIECLSGLPYTNPCYEPGVIEFLAVAKRNGCLGLNAQPVLDAFRHTLDIFHANRRAEAIEAGCYAGFVEGLWIHQTDEPQFRYSGELCVSPYSDEEERFYRGGRIFGVIISGEAELFLDDVWSVPDAFGRLIPNRFTLREDHHKEAFIDGDKMTIVGLTYPSYAERDPKCREIIKEWRGAGYLTIPILLP